MGRTLDRKIAKLPVARRQRIAARTLELIAEEMSLRQLRLALDRTQEDVAKVLNVGQDTVSRYEKRADLLLSTLQQYIRAMGGQLSLVAEFPTRPPVRINTLADIHEGPRRATG